MLLNLKEDSLDAALDIFDGLVHKFLKLTVLPQHLILGLKDRLLHFANIQMQRRKTIKIFLRIVDYQLQWPYFMVPVRLVITYSAYYTFMDAFGLDADQVEHLTCVVVTFGAFWVVELVRHFLDWLLINILLISDKVHTHIQEIVF